MAEQRQDMERSSSTGWLSLIAGMILAVAGAAGGYAFSTGLPHIDGLAASTSKAQQVAFVPLPPMLISLGSGGAARHLRFTAQLEVTPGREAEVTAVMPRIADVLNGYLRVLEIGVIESPSALVQIRGQMLRRLQIIVGDGLIRDLLVIEFVVS